MDETTAEGVTPWYITESYDSNVTISDFNDTVMLSTTMTSSLSTNDVSLSVAKYISFVITVVILSLGLFGNISTIVVMTRRRNKLSTHAAYLIALAISDIKSLLIVAINKPLLIEIFQVDLRALTVTGCKIFKYVGRASIICSSFVVALICIERFIAVWFPLKARILLSKKTATISCCAIFGTVYLVVIPSVVHTGVKRGICLPDFAIMPHYVLPKVLSIVSWALYSLIPTLILSVLTPMIIVELRRQQRHRTQMGDQKTDDTTARITVVLISIICLHFFLICLTSVVFWVLNFIGINVLASKAEWSKTFRDVYEHAELINYACHFFLYGLSSRDFRKQVRLTFGCYMTGSSSSTEEVPSSSTLKTNPERKYSKSEESKVVAN